MEHKHKRDNKAQPMARLWLFIGLGLTVATLFLTMYVTKRIARLQANLPCPTCEACAECSDGESLCVGGFDRELRIGDTLYSHVCICP